MKKLLVINVLLNIITLMLIIFKPSILGIPDVYVNVFKTFSLIIYLGTIATALKSMDKTLSTNLVYTHFNPEVCRKCGYKLCICNLYPPPPEKPKKTDLLTLTILEEDTKPVNKCVIKS